MREQTEDMFVEEIIETIDYDIYKEILEYEREEEEQSDERIGIKIILHRYYNWRTNLG